MLGQGLDGENGRGLMGTKWQELCQQRGGGAGQLRGDEGLAKGTKSWLRLKGNIYHLIHKTFWPANTCLVSQTHWRHCDHDAINRLINFEIESNLLRGLAHRAGRQSACCHVLSGPECWEPLRKEQVEQTQNSESSVQFTLSVSGWIISVMVTEIMTLRGVNLTSALLQYSR